MMEQWLTRFAYTKDGTFGTLGRFLTIEEEWQDNIPNISCIPTGVYVCRSSIFHRGGYPSYEIMDVPGRDLVKFHRAMTEEDLRGCVGIAMRLGEIIRTHVRIHTPFKVSVPGKDSSGHQFLFANPL